MDSGSSWAESVEPPRSPWINFGGLVVALLTLIVPLMTISVYSSPPLSGELIEGLPTTERTQPPRIQPATLIQPPR